MRTALLADDICRQSLEKYAAVTHLSVQLYDANAQAVGGRISPDSLHGVFDEFGYDPGVFTDCAEQCLLRPADTTDVVIERTYGLAVVGTHLVLEGDIVGAAVTGYALIEFCQSSTIAALARRANVPFRRIWGIAQQMRPMPEHRLAAHGALLQVLGQTTLQHVARTRDLQAVASELERRVHERTRELVSANDLLGRELDDRTRAELRVRQLLARLVVIQEDERRRIARDVHDNLGQQMVALKLKLELLQSRTDTDAWRQELGEVQDLLFGLDRDLLAFTRELRPALLEEFGLVHALRSFVSEWSHIHRIGSSFHEFGTERLQLRPDVDINVFRMVQEALNNVHKHAHATHVGVGLQTRNHSLVLTVEDNGVGFDPSTVASRDTGSGRGLTGMRERIWLVGGQLEIEARPGDGTALIVRIPIDAPEPGAHD